MNIDESKIEEAITSNTKAILTLNYGGVSCDYKSIKEIARKHNLYVIEDNAHGTGARYGSTFLGSFGHISTFSFDHLKSINCGQGGGIAINDPTLLERFYVHYEFGTNRRSF
jgi:dTDP-4-amino-4,6-dideoxygalactose transaminase